MRALILLPALTALLAAQTPNEAFFQGDPSKVARFCVEKALARDPKNVDYMVLAGDILSAGGDRPGALAWYAKAMNQKPRDPDTYLLLGRAYLISMQDRKTSEEMFAKAERHGPLSGSQRRDMAQAFKMVGDGAAVRAQVQKAKDRVSDDPEGTTEFATWLLDAGFPDEGRQLLDLTPKDRLRDFDGLKEVASAFLRARDPKAALEWLNRAVALKPRNLKGYREAAVALADHAHPEDRPALKERAVALVETGFAEKDLDNDALADQAWVFLAFGEREKAEALFRQIVLSKKVEASSLRAIGWAYLRLGMNEEALRAYSLVMEGRGSGSTLGVGQVGPGFGVFVAIDIPAITKKNALAQAALDLASKGYLEKALPLMSEAYLLDVEDFDWAIKFGQACIKGGQREQAVHYFAKAAKGGAKERECWEQLAQAFLELSRTAAPASAN